MKGMKLRLLVMGGVISFLGVALMASRGVKAEYGGLLGWASSSSRSGWSGSSPFDRRRWRTMS